MAGGVHGKKAIERQSGWLRLEDGDILEQGKVSCFSHRHAVSEETQPHGH